ncbi:Lectin-domain containing receptor kinase A4.2 [Hordeum vulgare]|nr:Lectin-domain containing receptor kinase A4.2 [Hordeum vulgare]
MFLHILEMSQVTPMPDKKCKCFIPCQLLFLFIGLNQASFTITNDQFVYSGFAQANLNLDGAAIITPDGLLELTNGTFNLKGHANPTDLHFHALPSGYVQSFSISFVFSIFLAYLDKSDDGTQGFNKKKILRAGRFEKVYKGILPTSQLEVAVKKLSHYSNREQRNSLLGLLAWVAFVTATPCSYLVIAWEKVTRGQRPVKKNANGNRIMLVDLVLENWQKGSMVGIIDHRLQGKCKTDEACLVLKLGLLCS